MFYIWAPTASTGKCCRFWEKNWFGNADVCWWKVSCTLWITSGISHGPYGVWCKSCCGWPSQESTPEANCCDSFHHISESCWTSHLSCFTASQSCLSLGQGLPLAPSSDRGARINVEVYGSINLSLGHLCAQWAPSCRNLRSQILLGGVNPIRIWSPPPTPLKLDISCADWWNYLQGPETGERRMGWGRYNFMEQLLDSFVSWLICVCTSIFSRNSTM